MTGIFVGLGSNLGDPIRQLRNAERRLAGIRGIAVRNASPVYKTQPQSKRDQPWFNNQVLELECGPQWRAPTLLGTLLAVEAELGRDRTEEDRFGPRSIDLDLLLFGNEVRMDAQLIVPHPRMFERAFVLVPLHDIAPALIFPDGSAIQCRLAALEYNVSDGRIHQEFGVTVCGNG